MVRTSTILGVMLGLAAAFAAMTAVIGMAMPRFHPTVAVAR